MSQFTGYSDNEYIYLRDGNEYRIHSSLLSSLFKNYGYCVDPGAHNNIALSTDEINKLQKIALANNDYVIVNIIKTQGGRKAPSPRMANEGIMHETTFNEKHRYEHLNSENKRCILNLLRVILNIGLYLGGWKGTEEPYITNLKFSDNVRTELKIIPLLNTLHNDAHYPLVKNFPIMGYYKVSREVTFTSIKPSIVNESLNIEQCLNSLSLGVNRDNHLMASYLISTTYYYITTVCNTSLPMLEPLIISLTQINT